MKNNMNLDSKNKEWKEFVFEQLFDIDSTSSGIDRNKLIKGKGVIPYLTRSEKDNGLDSFICKQSDKYKTDDANVITVGLDTQTVFYQPNKFYTGQNVQVLKCEYLNKENAQFLIPLIKRQMEKFNWGGNGATLTRLRRSKLLLPVNKKGEPDFEFMEAFMKQKEREKFQEYDNYIRKRIKELKKFTNVEPIAEKEFLEFEIEKLFEVKSGKRLTKADMKKGNKPFIGATDSNNGITEFVSNNNASEDSNVLGVNYNGSVVENFYHPYKAIFSDDVKRLSFKEIEDNKHLFLFVKTQILKQKTKYQYGYKFNGTRMNRQKIMLPVNDQSEPDYDYMENYMKQLEYKKLNEYLTKKEKLNANA